MIFYGGGMGNPNQHAVGPLPMVVAGGGVARRNRHLELAAGDARRQSLADGRERVRQPDRDVRREQWHDRPVLMRRSAGVRLLTRPVKAAHSKECQTSS